MGAEARLTLTGRQRDEAGQETVIKSSFPADYYEKGGSCYILYEEQAQDSGAVTRNAIKLKGSVLEMTRRGEIHSRMVFEAGKSHLTDYVTPYGTLRMEILTKALEISRRDNGLEAVLDYTLYLDGQFLSDCELTVSMNLFP